MKVSREDVVAVVRDAKIVSDPDKLRDDIKLSDQGIDSLAIFDFILQLQEKYNVQIPDADIDQLVSIPAIVDYLNQRLS
jgi:acyl carrier protein